MEIVKYRIDPQKTRPYFVLWIQKKICINFQHNNTDNNKIWISPRMYNIHFAVICLSCILLYIRDHKKWQVQVEKMVMSTLYIVHDIKIVPVSPVLIHSLFRTFSSPDIHKCVSRSHIFYRLLLVFDPYRFTSNKNAKMPHKNHNTRQNVP